MVLLENLIILKSLMKKIEIVVQKILHLQQFDAVVQAMLIMKTLQELKQSTDLVSTWGNNNDY